MSIFTMSEILANVKVKEEPKDWDSYSNFESAAIALREEIECYNYFDPILIKQEVKQEEVISEIHDCRQSTLSPNFKSTKKQSNTTWFTKCEVCNKTFSDSNSFLKHIDAQRDSYCVKNLFPWNSNQLPNRHHPNNMFMCKTCKRRFFDDAGIRRHYTMQGGVCKKHLQCRICFISFKTRAQVLKHINTEHKTHKCDCCSAVFVRERYLNFHIISCHRNNKVIPLVDISEKLQDYSKNSDTIRIDIKDEDMANVKTEVTPLDIKTNIKTENVSNADTEMKVLDPELLKQRVPLSRDNIKTEPTIRHLERMKYARKNVSNGDQLSKKANNKTLSRHYRNNRRKAVRNVRGYQQTVNKYQETHQKFNAKTSIAKANVTIREINQNEFSNTILINMNESSPMTESNRGVNKNAFTSSLLINPMSFLMEPTYGLPDYYNLGGDPDFNNA